MITRRCDQRLSHSLPEIATEVLAVSGDEMSGAGRESCGKNRPVFLGEINASCVGFTTHLELADQVADEVVKLIKADDVVHRRWPAFQI